MENLKVLFPVHIRKKIKNNLWLNDLEEIRIRAGQPIELAYSGKTRYLCSSPAEGRRVQGSFLYVQPGRRLGPPRSKCCLFLIFSRSKQKPPM